MRIGDLNKRITLQSPVRTEDGMGGFITTWKDEATIWAAIWPISASEQIKGMSAEMMSTLRIRVRYLEDIDSTWRIKYGNRYFAMMGIVNPNEANKIMDIICKEAA